MSRRRKSWVPIATIPNVTFQDSVESKTFAIGLASDSRLKRLVKRHPNLATYLNSFTDSFGAEIQPSIVLSLKDSKKLPIKADVLGSFCDAVAISVILKSWAHLVADDVGPIFWSDSFQVYPWTIDKNYQSMIGQTMAFMAVHDVNEFKGQAFPEVPVRQIRSWGIDKDLIRILLAQWERTFRSKRKLKKNVRLFRSLNMAVQAAKMPGGAAATFYDTGRQIALWISAFEILAHPDDGPSGTAHVVKLLTKSLDTEVDKKISNSNSPVAEKLKEGKRKLRRTLNKIYGALYSIRNDFLHGNEVAARKLKVSGNGRQFISLAPPLYRFALLGFLKEYTDIDTIEAGEKLRTGNFNFSRNYEVYKNRKLYEECMSKALDKKKLRSSAARRKI